MKFIVMVVFALGIALEVNSDSLQFTKQEFRRKYGDLDLTQGEKQWGPSLSEIVDLTFDYVKLFSWRTFINYAIVDSIADEQFYNVTFEQMGIFKKYQDPDLAEEL